MPFFTSTSPDLTYGIPFELGSGVLASYATVSDWDISLGGLGFNLRPSREYPYRRATENIRKDQIDTSGEPGEQSLTSWWQRSQSDWSGGAGVKWYEPGADEATVGRFYTSHGVDVWTPGQFSLLRKTAAAGSAAADPVYLASAMVSGVAGYVKVTGNTAVWTPSSGSTISKTMAGASGSKPAVAGRKVYVGHAAGIAEIDYTASTITDVWTHGSAVRCWWIKNRLIVAVGNALYELAASAAAGAITTVGTLIFTHPHTAWTWTDVADTGAAIVAAGYADSDSHIVAFTIENDGSGVPQLVGGSPVAKLPPAERVACMGVYLGNILVLGTSAGVRVGEVAPTGEIRYGPLTVETTSAVNDVAFRDRFAYCCVTADLEDGSSGAVRVDLSASVDEAERRAWAWDVPVGTSGAASSIALMGDRVVLAASGIVYVQSATEYVNSGWLTFGRVRFRTVEPKAFRLFRLEVDVTDGSAAVRVDSPTGSETTLVTFTDDYVTDSDVGITVPNESIHQWLQFRITLTPGTYSPTVTAFGVKAAPAPGRVRLYQFPLSCFDRESDRWGNEAGAPGAAYARLAALEGVEEAAEPIRVVDNRTGESFVGIVDAVEFSATEPPSSAESGFGGLALVTVRRL